MLAISTLFSDSINGSRAAALGHSLTCAQVGRGGLELPTSALERPERCADEVAEIETPERRVGFYQDGFR